MRKTLTFILLATTAAQAQLISGLDSLANGGCYIPEKSKSSANLDICSQMKLQVDLSVDICKFAPDLPGLTKKKNVLSIDADKYMQEFCNKAIGQKAQSAIADMDIFSKENNFNFENSEDKNSTNQAEENAGKFFAKGGGGSPTEIMKNSESISRQALYSGNQKVMKEIVNYAKNSNKQMSTVTSKDLSAPSNYTAYLLDRKNLVKAATSDHYEQSPLAVSTAVRQKVADIEDQAKASEEAQKISANATDKVDFGLNKRIQLYLDVLAKDDDYAIPTQEMVALLREDLRPDAIAKIKQQIKREAIIISELTQIDKARKDLIAIAGTKAVVVSRKFDEEAAQGEIDKLISTSSSSGGGSGFLSSIKNAVSSAAGGAASGIFDNIAGAAGDAASGIFNNIAGDAFSGVGKALTDAAGDAFAGVIKDASGAVTGAISDFVVDTATGVVTGVIKDASGAITKVVVDTATGIVTDVATGVVKGAVDVATDVVKGTTTTAIKGIENSISSAINVDSTIKKASVDTAKSVATTTKKAKDAADDVAKDVAKGTADVTKDVTAATVKGTKEVAKNTLNSAKDATEESKNGWDSGWSSGWGSGE